jgi:hypothetical protein
MDADDVAKPYRLEMQLDCLSENPGIALVGGAIEIIDSGRGVSCTRNAYLRTGAAEASLAGSQRHRAPTVLFRRSVRGEVGGFRKAYLHAEDYDLWLRMLERFALTNLDEVLLGYRRHEGTVCQECQATSGVSPVCSELRRVCA